MKRVHFIGIKGVGMSALALVMHGLGYTVSGSDVPNSYGRTGELLEAAGIPTNDFSPDVITPAIDLVVLGTSFGTSNPELLKATELNVTILPYSEALQQLTQTKKLIAVSGTHGKTTTTSLLAYLLMSSKLSPSWIIGTTEISGLPAHGGAGESDWFVLEADEYKKASDDLTPKFLDYTPYGLLINNIEHDHPDVYPTLESFKAAFTKLTHRVRADGFIVANGDDENVMDVLRAYNNKTLTFGFKADNTYQIDYDHNTNSFFLHTKSEQFGPFKLQLRGQHNIYNAAGAAVMALEIGVKESQITASLPNFTTVERRYQLLGITKNNSVVIDDYAHHPTAVAATLKTAKQDYPNRKLWVAFQPHTYSRTRTLLDEFARCFEAADTVLITDIFASARENEVTITAEEVVKNISLHHPNATYVPYDQLESYADQHLPPNSVLIVMGATKINEIGQNLVAP